MRTAVSKLLLGAVAAASVAAAACTSVQDQGNTGILAVTPDHLVATVFVGSTEPQPLTIHTRNLGAGELHWVARIRDASPWLTISSSSGVAGDSVLLWANPTGLALGDYGDTVVVSDEDRAETVAVPLQFRIVPGLPPPAPPRRLAFTPEPASGPAGSMRLVQVTALDSAGNIAPGFTAAVTLSAIPDSGAISGTTSVAAVAGVATFSNFGLVTAGCRRLIASSPGLPPDTSATFCITPGAAAALVFTTQPYPPTFSCSGTGFALGPVSVVIRDAFGNTVVSSVSEVHVALDSNSAGATLSGTTTAAAVGGVAGFSNLSVDRFGFGFRLVATAAGLTQATSDPFGYPADACWDHLVFTVQPTNTAVDSVIAPPVHLCAVNGFGNVDTSFAGAVFVELGSNPGSAVLSGTLVSAAVTGCVTFSDLSIDKAGAGYTLTAFHAGLVSAMSSPFNIGP